MRKIKFLYSVTFILALVVTIISPGIALGVKYKTSGNYTDSSGATHQWAINEAHTLIWDGQPYIPVGGTFESRYISLGANDDNYKADIAALDLLKSKGITDIILKSTSPITSTDPAAWQKIINYLDTNGFTYGIDMSDGPKEPLRGFLISPNLYKLDGPTDETRITCDWPDVDSAIYLVINRTNMNIDFSGGALVKDGKMTINLLSPLSSSQVLIIYPRKVFKSVADGGVGDIWSGFSEYRDRVIVFFKDLKLGTGMRFFIEPFTGKMDFTKDMTGFLPDSDKFRIGLEAYLTKKYVHEGTVNSVWGINEDIRSIENAAGIIPLWSGGRGISYAYDKINAKFLPIDTTVSQLWQDVINYRDYSAQEYMNTIADTLKKQVANVPVIFKSSTYHRIFANPYGIGGFDGLGAKAYGTTEQQIADIAGPAYSLAEESSKTSWFIADTQSGADNINYSSETSLYASLDVFREIGSKGFFVDRLQALPDESRGSSSMVNHAEQLDWLKKFKDSIKPAAMLDSKPRVINYPIIPTTGAYVKKLSDNTWWLPTLRIGNTSYVGDGLNGYTFLGDDKSYLWSSTGEKVVTFKSGPTGFPSVSFPDGADINKKKGDTFTVTLSSTPTVLRGMDFSFAFPYETADSMIKALSNLIPEADRLQVNVKYAREDLNRAKSVLGNGQPMIAYDIAQNAIQELMKSTGGETWIEGEKSIAHNFTEVSAIPGTSENLALVLDTADDPPISYYSATYSPVVRTNASYEIWLAGTLPADSSPIEYSIDDISWNTLEASAITQYAPGMSWYKIGSANLGPGKHTLKFKVNDRRPSDNRYFFRIDAVVLSPKAFKPNGIVKLY